MINQNKKHASQRWQWWPIQVEGPRGFDNRRALTLVEMLVATALTLIMMALVAQLFGMLGKGVNGSRNRVELYNRVRATGQRLRQDLSGLTVNFEVPVSPEDAVGYFEYIEGPETDELSYGTPNSLAFDREVVLGNYSLSSPFKKTNRATQAGNDKGFPDELVELQKYMTTFESDDRLVGDVDDVLLFTTRSSGAPFSGKLDAEIIESPVAEVVWYCRLVPNTFNPRQYNLYRRQRIVMGNPAKLAGTFSRDGANDPLSTIGQDKVNALNVSAIWNLDPAEQLRQRWNILEEKTDISCRLEGDYFVPNTPGDLTKRENRFCHELYVHPTPGPLAGEEEIVFNPQSSHLGFDTPTRYGEDLILSNCIGFDVRIFDHTNPVAKSTGYGIAVPGSPGFSHIESPVAALYTEIEGAFVPVYADLGFGGKLASGFMYAPDNNANRLRWPMYDTWSTTDSYSNMPYKERARGIEVRIRCFEPASKQVIQLTVQETFEHE